MLADKIYSGRDQLAPVGPGAGPATGAGRGADAAAGAARLAAASRVTRGRRSSLAVEAPLPPEFVRTLEALRKHRKA